MLGAIGILAFVFFVSLVAGLVGGIMIAAAAKRYEKNDRARSPKQLPWAGRDLSQPFDFKGESAGIVDSCEHLEARP